MENFYLLIKIILVIISLYGSLKQYSNINNKLRHPQDIFTPHKTFIEAHCGVNREIFQNTLESFSKAIEYGIDSLETDLWLTKDNISVIVHGTSTGCLKGYYNSSGNIMNLTWDELSNLRTVKDNLKMPKLVDLFKIAKNKIYIDLELKDPRFDLVFPHVIKLIEEYDFFNQLSICSIHYEYYNKIKEYNNKNNKKILFGFGYRKNHKNEIDFNKKGNTINIHWTEATKEICDKTHQKGMGVVAWFGLSEYEKEENYENIIKNGVDVIVANYPKIAKNVRDRLYKY
jgi:glycerophosphoryl diester phosphodiesterase